MPLPTVCCVSFLTCKREMVSVCVNHVILSINVIAMCTYMHI